jgi:NAD(P)-dependent dehydrogenase (short-subunit alcohol dehydrogenase family)
MFGSVDILVNNAGIYPMAPMLQLTRDQWQRMIDEATGIDIFQRDASRLLTIAGAMTYLVEHGADPVG